mmetsp:Transcript_17682/g.33533  ORF Transcript_17682/g.33533 Transcript_17682/m.33533 type:complete len:193 (-) Transcript_17682:8-586(-)
MTNDGSDHNSTLNSAAEKDGMLRSEAAALSIDFVDRDNHHQHQSADDLYDDDDDEEPIMRSIRGSSVGAQRAARLRRTITLRRTIMFTALFEGVTCFMRFGLGLQSTRDTSSLAKYTGGLRIHHGYLGIVLATVSYLWCQDRSTTGSSSSSNHIHLWMFPVGCALIISDLIHHFIVLYATTGDPQFDLVYPD